MAKAAIKRQRPGRIFRQRKIDESIAEIVRDNNIRFLVDRRPFEKLCFAVAADRDTFETALVLLSTALRALVQLREVYDQMIVAYRMAQRYPWDQRLIKRSEHLHFVWMVFVNLCYLLEEKFKLAAKSHNAVVAAFKRGNSINIQKGVGRISKGLRKHIRSRGEFTHQWRQSHEIISQYHTIELAHSLGRMPRDYLWPVAHPDFDGNEKSDSYRRRYSFGSNRRLQRRSAADFDEHYRRTKTCRRGTSRQNSQIG